MARLTVKRWRDRMGKRPDARAIARPKKIMITNGLKSRALLRDPLDQRTVVGKAFRARIDALTSDLGGNLTTAQTTLVDRTCRLSILAQLAWNELARVGVLNKRGDVVAAFDVFLRVVRDERDILRLLGLERRAKPVPDLQEYLNRLTEKKDVPA